MADIPAAAESLVRALINSHDARRLKAALESISRIACVRPLLRKVIHLAAHVGDVSIYAAIASHETSVCARTMISSSDLPLLESRDGRGNTPMFVAARAGHAALIRVMIAAGAAHTHNEGGKTALWIAAHEGHTEACIALVQGGATHACCGGGVSPLSAAAYNGHTETCRTLLQLGASVCEDQPRAPPAPPARTRTPLCWAATNGHLAVVRLFVEEAKVEAGDRGSTTSMAEACKSIHITSPFYAAALYDRRDVAEYLWQFQKHTTYGAGHSVLYVAARRGDAGVCELLITHPSIRMSPNVKNDEEHVTPLFAAAATGRESVIRVLLSHGAHVNIQSKTAGTYPLFEAAGRGHTRCCALLLDRGATHMTTKYGWTPILFAAQHKHTACCRLLLHRGASQDPVQLMQDGISHRFAGNTPLHVAVATNNLELARFFLEYGAEQRPNHAGINPLSLAVRMHLHDMTELLIRHDTPGAATRRPQRGPGPLYEAAISGDVRMCKLLMDHAIVA
jgi:ankyrin repeat protein